MGLRGPAPIPSVIQIARGDPGHRAKGQYRKEMKPPSSSFKTPRNLDTEGKKEWKRLMIAFGKMEVQGQKLLTDIDKTALILHCQNYSRYLSAGKNVNKNGITIEIKDDKGKVKNVIKNPAVEIELKTGGLHLKTCQQFGFTPSARARIQITPSVTSKQNELDEFLNSNTG